MILGWLQALTPDPFGDHFSIKNRKKTAQGRPKGAQSRKNDQLKTHAKIDAAKGMKSMPNCIQNDAKIDAKIFVLPCYFEKGGNAPNCLFYNRKRGSGHLQIKNKFIKNRCKLKAWKKGAKRSQQGAKIGSKIH